MPPKSRRRAREAALRALYQIEVGKATLGEAIENVAEEQALSEDLRHYAERLVRGVTSRRTELEARIGERLTEWTVDRLAVVDRLLLLLGAYELAYCLEVPPAVTLNEAIELAKKYSTGESGRFVNGVLAQVMESVPKANDRPGEGPSEAPADPVPDVEERQPEIVVEGTEAYEEFEKTGPWVIRENGKS